MIKHKTIHFSITKDFEKIFQEAKDLLSKDKEWQRLIKEKMKNDKRVKPGRQESAMIRYWIGFYIREAKKRMLEEIKK